MVEITADEQEKRKKREKKKKEMRLFKRPLRQYQAN